MTSIYPSSTSSSSSTSSKNLLRISGMASGIDTDSVVKSMVSNYQAKIDKANQAKQTLQWKQDGYRDIIKGIKGLQDYFNATSSKYILGGSAMNLNTATSDTGSVASATATASAAAGTYSVNVTQLAEQAKITGSSLNSMIDVSTDASSAAKWSGAKFSLTIDGTATSIQLDAITDSNSSGDVIDEVVSNINKQIASKGLSGVTASYVKDGSATYVKFTNTTGKAVSVSDINQSDGTTKIVSGKSIGGNITSTSKLSDLGITDSISFKLSYDSTTTTTPVSVTASSTDTLQSLMDKVKSATNGAVTMVVDDATGKISFQSKNTGSASSITINDTSTGVNHITNLGIPTNTATATGKDAIVKITEPGKAATTTTQSSNQFTINGVSYNLVNKGTANVTVTGSTDNIVKNFKSFIDDYNTIVSTINTKLTEKSNKDYAPLTDDQKSSMSESQIKAWEDKAKVGVLRNDDYLNDVMTQLRGIFSSPVYSSYTDPTTNTKISLSLGKYGSSSIGIDTSSDVTDGGKLVLVDETKLTDAIKNNFDDFKKMFSGASSTPLGKTASGQDEPYVGSKTYMEDGLFTRMNTILTSYVATPGIGTDGTYTLSGSMNIFVNKQYDFSTSGTASKNTLPDQVYSKTLSITKLKTQMSDAETRYYAKFTALETAMTKLNSQQSQLSSMLGS